MMYHLFENEMVSVSSFNAVALSMFSIGSFLLSCIIAVVIGWGFASSLLPEFGTFMIHKGVYFIGVLSIMCFGAGLWAIYLKNGIIDQIKKETQTDGGPIGR